ncbi:hypothetical protein GCM10027595_05780 [Corynebacterium nasicanis]
MGGTDEVVVGGQFRVSDAADAVDYGGDGAFSLGGSYRWHAPPIMMRTAVLAAMRFRGATWVSLWVDGDTCNLKRAVGSVQENLCMRVFAGGVC